MWLVKFEPKRKNLASGLQRGGQRVDQGQQEETPVSIEPVNTVKQ